MLTKFGFGYFSIAQNKQLVVGYNIDFTNNKAQPIVFTDVEKLLKSISNGVG